MLNALIYNVIQGLVTVAGLVHVQTVNHVIMIVNATVLALQKLAQQLVLPQHHLAQQP